MTVREMIERLKDMPPESIVLARDADGEFNDFYPEDVIVDYMRYVEGWGEWHRASNGQMAVVISP